MKRFVTKMTMALALGGSLIAAVPAQARDHDGFRGGGGRGWSDHGGRGGYDRGYGYGGYGRGYGGYRGPYYGGGYGYRGYYGPRYYYDDAGVAIGAGVLGLALGAAIADRPYYGYGYYGY